MHLISLRSNLRSGYKTIGAPREAVGRGVVPKWERNV